MKGFTYRLQRLLDYRNMQKQQRRMELMQAQYQLNCAEAELERRQQAYNTLLYEPLGAEKKSLTAQFLRQRNKNLMYQRENIRRQEMEVEKAREYCRQCLSNVQDAELEVKKLTKHREKRLMEWNKVQRKVEAVKVDEFNARSQQDTEE